MKKLISFLLIFSLSITYAQAQKNMVKGIVFDEIGTPLPGASVTIKGTKTGVTTDFDGNYMIKVGPTGILKVSFMGFTSKEIAVKGRTKIDITLKPDVSQLDEVMIVSFGQQKKRSIVSSMTTVKPAELKIASSNLTTALAGRVSGLIAYQRGGEPGNDNAEFFIRGVTTFGYGSSPLILIDGVELSVSDLRRLRPDDIEAFSILKDASATALYGARGANGVIFVTTKEGEEGPVRVSVRIESSMSRPTSNIKLADPITYMKLGNEAVRTRDPLGLLPYSLEKIENTEAGTNSQLYPTTDWHKELFKDYTVNKRFNLNLKGGGKTARYYVSIAGSQDNGILKVPKINDFNSNINYKQYNLRSNTNINLTKSSKLKLSFNVNFENLTGPRQSGSDIYKMVMRSNPVYFKPYYEKDSENEFTKHILFGNYDNGQYLNPYAEMVSGYKESSKSKIIAQLEFKQDLDFITEGLKFKLIFNGTKKSSYIVDRFYKPYYYTPKLNRETKEVKLIPLNEEEGTEHLSFNQRDRYISSTTYLESRLHYASEIDDVNEVSGLLVFTMNNRLTSLSIKDSKNLEKSLPYRNMGIAGRFTYSNSQRYFAEINFGYNGSERFAKKERWGFFPSIGLGWLVSDEAFMKSTHKSINTLKIKGSYGLVGNDRIGGSNDRFFYLSRVNLNKGGYTTGKDFDNGYHGVSISRYANENITWETARKMNIGLELGLFNQIDLKVDIFKEKRSNILANRILPSSMGLQAGVRANIGEAESSGIDGSLVYTKNFRSGFWLQGRGNFTYATNKITKMEEPDYSKTPWLSRVGQPIKQWWGYVAERLFVDQNEVNNSPTQSFGGEYSGGDIKYKDINNDGKITSLDKVPIGNPTVPEIVYGFGLSTGFKGFDFSCFFQGAANSSFFVNPANVSPFVGEKQLIKSYADSHWSETNRDIYALWPRLSNKNVNNNTQISTWFMQDGAFLRLKTVEVGYTLSTKTTARLKMEKIRFYTSGTNIFVKSKFKLWDPELAGKGLGYPNQRVFNLGLNVSF